MAPPLNCQIICSAVPVMAGNTFEKIKLGAKEVAEIFTDSDTYLGSQIVILIWVQKMKMKTWNFRMKQGTNEYRVHSKLRTHCNQERKKPGK